MSKSSAWLAIIGLGLVGLVIGVAFAWLSDDRNITPEILRKSLEGPEASHDAAMAFILRLSIGGLIGVLLGSLAGYGLTLIPRRQGGT